MTTDEQRREQGRLRAKRYRANQRGERDASVTELRDVCVTIRDVLRDEIAPQLSEIGAILAVLGGTGALQGLPSTTTERTVTRDGNARDVTQALERDANGDGCPPWRVELPTDAERARAHDAIAKIRADLQ